MPFEKGKSGNPDGTRKQKKFYDALNLAIGGDDPRRLRNIAEKLVSAAEAGEQWAIKEVADRLDGKPAQTTELKAEVETRTFREMTDAELLAIAKSGSTRDAETEASEAGPDSVH